MPVYTGCLNSHYFRLNLVGTSTRFTHLGNGPKRFIRTWIPPKGENLGASKHSLCHSCFHLLVWVWTLFDFQLQNMYVCLLKLERPGGFCCSKDAEHIREVST